MRTEASRPPPAGAARRLAPAALALAMAVGAGCGGAGRAPAGSDGRVTVAAGFYPLAEAAQQVGGGRVVVHNLTAAGAEPHDLELTPRQVDRLLDADVVVYLGRGFQPAVEQAVRGREGVSVDLLERVGPLGPRSDPHFWLDPSRMGRAVDAVEDALAEVSPADRARFAAGAGSYRAALADLDRSFAAGLARCDRRTFVTAHAAFGHLAARYGLTQLAVSGLSPEADPDPARLAELTDAIRTAGITTVFHETLVSPRVAETLAREAGVTTAVLDPIEGLADDRPGPGRHYVALMERNLAALRAALGCR